LIPKKNEQLEKPKERSFLLGSSFVGLGWGHGTTRLSPPLSLEGVLALAAGLVARLVVVVLAFTFVLGLGLAAWLGLWLGLAGAATVLAVSV
jgi:hypothetical protein